ncbi:MAG TPA: hypothetical protein VKT75_05875 [Acidobacteriaceae bacterium]|nr:hypothetical protein [Acidobacteriaceae bacterium]
MQITWRDLMTATHGMFFGGLFLMAVFGMVVLLAQSLGTRGELQRTQAALRWERVYLVVIVLLGWAAVLSGAYIVYPWYRALPPPGADLAGYPQRLLLSDPRTAGWHTLGMEWKEHVAWFAPMLITAAAWILIRFQSAGQEMRRVRITVAAFALTALLATAIAAGLGALIDKNAPVSGGSIIHLSRGAE